MPIIKMKS
jgi:Eukaryotic aspartyl protease